MKKLLFILTATCWTISLSIHIVSLTGFDVATWFPYVWALHIGVFVVFIPALLILRKFQHTPHPTYRSYFSGLPRWLIILTVACCLYAVINFFLFAFSFHGTATIRDGQYVLLRHGSIIKTLTELEYRWHNSQAVRLFSGHWMAFYSLAMIILYPSVWPGRQAPTAII